MKKLALPLFFLLLTSGTRAQRGLDVYHYDFSLTLSDANDSIGGLGFIRTVITSTNQSYVFDLTGINAEGKGMKVATVDVLVNRRKIASGFTHNADRLAVQASLQQGDSAVFVINYKGIPDDGLIISRNKFNHRTFFADNWPNRAHHWIPCVDDPADKATVAFTVDAPSHYQVISNGLQTEETNLSPTVKRTVWEETVPLPTKVMVIGVADFAVGSAGMVNDCIPVTSWVYPENRNEGFTDYVQAKDILAWYINYIGPYAYRKLANIQSKTIFGGMENASAIFYYENSVTGQHREEALLAHEIVHQWFGNSATEKSFAHLWLSEGFATYLTHIYLEARYGTDSLNHRMRDERKEVLSFVRDAKRPVVDPTPELMQLLNANSYQKGGWILHMLRRQLGDSIFHKIIRSYYDQYKLSNADTRDFQQVCEKISGQKLDRFFEQWLQRPENPRLSVDWNYNTAKKELSVTVRQLQSAVFEFPLEIRCTGSAVQDNKLQVTKAEETFILPLSFAPNSLVSDPNVSLLAEITVKRLN